jgi:hypothetical protein
MHLPFSFGGSACPMQFRLQTYNCVVMIPEHHTHARNGATQGAAGPALPDGQRRPLGG